MKSFGIACAAALAFGLPMAAAAGPVDGKADLICATLRTVECGSAGECLEGSAEDVNAPSFFHVSFDTGTIRAERPDGSKLDTAIQTKTAVEGGIVLQGVENGRGWSTVINTATGRTVVAAVDDDVTFSIFAACTTKD